MAAGIGGFVALVHGPWLPLTVVIFAAALVTFLTSALAPEPMLRASVRAMVPTEEAMRRGDKHNWSWPG
jgi:hypothetical protein